MHTTVQVETRPAFRSALEHEQIEPHDSERRMLRVSDVVGVAELVDGSVVVDIDTGDGDESVSIGDKFDGASIVSAHDCDDGCRVCGDT